MSIKDKVIIVTGAAGGLGQSFSLRFAKEGAKVVVADIADVSNTMNLIESEGGCALAVKVDVTNQESVEQMCKDAFEKFGRIDGLVNNAAVYAGLKMGTFDLIDEKDWDLVMNVNVKGAWLCCKAVFPYMKEQGSGSIVNISSASILEGNPFFTHYVASKGAVLSMTRSISRNVGEYGIRANSITPGYTMTEASKGLAGDPESFKKNYEENIARRALKRALEAEDIVGGALFLLGDDSKCISGQNINIDGGGVHY